MEFIAQMQLFLGQAARAVEPAQLAAAAFRSLGDAAGVDRAATLLQSALEQPDIAAELAEMPDSVLEYLRAHFCEGHPARAAAGNWMEAELSRRTNAYKLEALLKPPPRPRSASARPIEPTVDEAESKAAVPAPPARAVPKRATAAPLRRSAAPAPPPPPPAPASAGTAEAAATETPTEAAYAALLGEIALPSTAPKKRDTAVWLWAAIIFIVLVMCAVLVAAVVVIQSLQPTAANPALLVASRFAGFG